ncbi:Regulator of G-protein signaling 14 [Saguinus oedipus]|uniref:Regulator of G-protein signaling 14 n=1 Tax=Saguinus oedipus TaxID=9490 RepID=A0ABQ9WA61_SAGOE|nr:Regulator of G-protein signaling 14 [Saguinus oedipus]
MLGGRREVETAQEARNIYQEFLSSQALSPVNIDRQAWLGEEVLAEPRPDMFRAQQLQVSGGGGVWDPPLGPDLDPGSAAPPPQPRLSCPALVPQIFNLMKFDSYARFVKSPLYRECLLAEAEGRPLREPGSLRLGSPDATRKGALRTACKRGRPRSLPLGVEELGQLPPVEGPGGRPLRKSFRRGGMPPSSFVALSL